MATNTSSGLADEDVTRETYRHLRMILIALPTLILVGIVLSALVLGPESIQSSISAYYLGPLRDVFVGAMVGTAVCLVAYRGAPLEDYALNLAGFYALFVALVPTKLTETLSGLKPDPEAYAELISSLQVTIAAVLLTVVVFLAFEWRTGHWAYKVLKQHTLTKWLFKASTLFSFAFVVLLIWNAFVTRSFDGIHLAATLLLIASMATAVASHAWPERSGSPLGRPTKRYKGLFWLMTVGGAILFVALKFFLLPKYATIVAEWWEISLFATFWFMETLRTWDAAGH